VTGRTDALGPDHELTLLEERLALYRKSRPWTGDLFAVESAAAAPPAQ